MASIGRDKNGTKRILFLCPMTKKRKTVRLGRCDLKTARNVCTHVEFLVTALASSTPMPPGTASWLAGIAPELRDRLARAGLIPKPVEVAVPTLSELVEQYKQQKECQNKPSTQENLRLVVADLYGFFDRTLVITKFTPASAVAFLNHLKTRGLAASTIARRLRRVKSLFTFAQKRKWLSENPFGEVRVLSSQPTDREAYVSMEDTERLLRAASPEWRVIIALSRFAGLRCPSEVLSLRWNDVHFAEDRMIVESPKTAHLPGKEYRIVPIFARLRPILEEAYELARDSAEFVVSTPWADRCRTTAQGPRGWVSVNLRTQMSRIVRRAGLILWPRMFNTLRASASTDIRNKFGEVAESAWIGHSAAIAKRHYSRVPAVLFRLAASPSAAQKAAHEPAQNGTA